MGLLSFSKYNAWSYRYYSWVGRVYHQSVDIICGRLMVGFIGCRSSVNIICGGIMVWFVVVFGR